MFDSFGCFFWYTDGKEWVEKTQHSWWHFYVNVWNIKNQMPAIAFQIVKNSQSSPTLMHCYRPLRAVDGSCAQNKPSALLTVHIYFLVMNNRWVSGEQGDNELTCSPLGPSLSLASAILYKKKNKILAFKE